MKLLVLNDSPNGHWLEVHRGGCADLNKAKYRRCQGADGGRWAWIEDHDTLTSAAESFASDFIDEGSMTLADALNEIYFAPCVTIPLDTKPEPKENPMTNPTADRKALIATLKNAGATGAFQRMSTAALLVEVAALAPPALPTFDFTGQADVKATEALFKAAWNDNAIPGTKNPTPDIQAALHDALKQAMGAFVTTRPPKGKASTPRVTHPLLTESTAIKKGASKITPEMEATRNTWTAEERTAAVAKLRADYPGISVRIVTEHLYWTKNVKCSEAGIKSIFAKLDAPADVTAAA